MGDIIGIVVFVLASLLLAVLIEIDKSHFEKSNRKKALLYPDEKAATLFKMSVKEYKEFKWREREIHEMRESCNQIETATLRHKNRLFDEMFSKNFSKLFMEHLRNPSLPIWYDFKTYQEERRCLIADLEDRRGAKFLRIGLKRYKKIRAIEREWEGLDRTLGSDSPKSRQKWNEFMGLFKNKGEMKRYQAYAWEEMKARQQDEMEEIYNDSYYHQVNFNTLWEYKLWK